MTETEFVTFVVALVGRKVRGQLLAATIGDYSIEIAGAAGTLRITVSGGPLGGWTRRQGTSKHNVPSVATTLFAELNRGAQDAEERCLMDGEETGSETVALRVDATKRLGPESP